MHFQFIWEALVVLFCGFCLMRIAGKKTIAQMTGLEVVTLLATASMIGHAVADKGLWQTLVTLCLFISLLLTVQFLSLKFDRLERWFVGKATVVVKDGRIVTPSLKKMRLTVDQLEARMREKGITALSDLKTATIEVSGEIGYEWARHAKPVTIGELEKLFAEWQAKLPPPQPKSSGNLFHEVFYEGHEKEIPSQLE